MVDSILDFQYFAPFRDGEEQNVENPPLTPAEKAGQAPPKRGMVLYKDCG